MWVKPGQLCILLLHVIRDCWFVNVTSNYIFIFKNFTAASYTSYTGTLTGTTSKILNDSDTGYAEILTASNSICSFNSQGGLAHVWMYH